MIFILQKNINNKMQHTTTSKEKPNLLFENFIISGLSQHELMDLDLNQYKNEKKDASILFSMFEDDLKCEKYLQFIWPNKINISNQNKEAQTHSFNVMDSNRNQTFFHCLIFTEEVCNYLVQNDFDANGAQGQKIISHLEQKVNKKTSVNEDDSGRDLLSKNQEKRNEMKLQNQIERILKDEIQQKMFNKMNSQKHDRIPSEQFQMKVNQCRQHACGTVINKRKGQKEYKNEKREEEKLQNFKERQENQRQKEAAVHKALAGATGMMNPSFISTKAGQLSNNNLTPNPKNQHLIDSSFAFDDKISKKDSELTSGKEAKFARALSTFQGFRQNENNLADKVDSRISNTSQYQNSQNNTIPTKERTVSFDVRNSTILDLQYGTGYSQSNIDGNIYTPDFKNLNLNILKQNQDNYLTKNGTLQDQDFDERKESNFKSEINFQNDNFKSFKESFLGIPHMVTEESLDISEDQFENLYQDVQHLNKELSEEFFVPVALVIQTKLEYHDHFRLILQNIYETIVNRKQSFSESLTDKYNSFGELIYAGKVNDQEEFQIDNFQFESQQEQIEICTEVFKNIPDINRCMTFAHMIATLSFLRTIPPPVFNSEVNILLNNKLLNFKENCFDQIPHKNSCLIRTIQVLDFQTILTCLKALLFEKTLIVLCTEVSLLFDVIEGLKQLIFPFTFDYASFLPANDTYIDAREVTLKQFFIDSNGFQPAIFAMTANPDEIQDFMEYPDAVILHIDCSLAILSKIQDPDEGNLPQFPDEIVLLQELNNQKNGCFQKFGKLESNSTESQENVCQTNMVIEIKNTIFSKLQFLFQKSFECINLDIENPRGSEFLDKKKLREEINDSDSPNSVNFYLKLIQTTSFVNFIDGYLDSEITNFDIVNSILLKNNKLQKKRYKIQSNTFSKFIPQIQKSVETLKQNDFDLLNCMYQINQNQFDIFQQDIKQDIQKDKDFEDSVIIFNYIMPPDRTCAFLFQRLQLYGQIKKKNSEKGEDEKKKKYSDMTQNTLISLIDYVFKNSDKQKLLDEQQKNAYEKMTNNLIESQQNFHQKSQSPISTELKSNLNVQNSILENNMNLQSQKSEPQETQSTSAPTQITITSQIDQNQKQDLDYTFENKNQFELSNPPNKFIHENNKFQLRVKVEKLPVLAAFIKKDNIKVLQEDEQFNQFGQMLIEFLKETSDQQQLTELQNGIYNQVWQFVMFIEKKQERSIIYGRKGLLSFINNLFLDVTEKQKRLFNFYFNIKDHIQDFIQQKIIVKQQKSQALINLIIRADEDQSNNLNIQVLSDNHSPESLHPESSPSDQIENKKKETKTEELFKKNALLLQQGRLQEMLKSNPVTKIKSNNQFFFSNYLLQLQKEANSILLNQVPINYQIQLLNLQQTFLSSAIPDVLHDNIFKSISKKIHEFQTNYEFISQKQLIQQKEHLIKPVNKYGKKHMWFWIETNNSKSNEQLFNNQLSYQEILTVMKFIINFENKNCYNHMLLQLFLNFPCCSLDYNQFLNENLQQHNLEKYSALPYNQISIDDNDDSNSKINRFNDAAQESCLDDERFKKIISIVKKQTDENQNLQQIICQKRNIIQNCLFPLNEIQIILDNLSRQQLIDLYLRIFQGSLTVLKSECISSQERAKMFSQEDQKILNYGISQICKNFPWCFPSDQKVDHVSSFQILKQRNSLNNTKSEIQDEILQGTNEIILNQFNSEKIQLNKFVLNPVLFLIQLKFYEVLYFLRQDLQNDPSCHQMIENFTKDKSLRPRFQTFVEERRPRLRSMEQINSLFFNDLSKIFEKIDNLEQGQIIFQNKRDTDKSLSNTYFEIIDEREFYNCSIEIELKQREDQRKQLIQVSYVDDENERNMVSVTFFDKNKVNNGTLCESVEVIVNKKPQNQIEKIMGKQNEKISVVRGSQKVENCCINQSFETRNSEFNVYPNIIKNTMQNKSSKLSINDIRGSQQTTNQLTERNSYNRNPSKNSSISRKSKNLFSGVLNILKRTSDSCNRSSKNLKLSQTHLKQSQTNLKLSQTNLKLSQTNLKQSGYSNQNQQIDYQINNFETSVRDSNFPNDICELKEEVNPKDNFQFYPGLNPQDEFIDNFDQILKSNKVKGRRDGVYKEPITSPIERSKNFLLAIAGFWEKYQIYLSKYQYSEFQDPQDIKERNDHLVKIYEEHLKKFKNYEPQFNEQNNSQSDSLIEEIEENQEISKQIFYVNLYNGIVLFKLAELCRYKNKLLFDLKGLQSWAALEHNSRIIIGNRSFTAYQIRYDIIKNIQNQKVDNYHVNQAYAIHLIDYSFFKPTSGSLNLSKLIFSDPEKIKVDLQREVRDFLKNKLKFRENFCPILLPCDLKQVLPVRLTMPVIQFMQQQQNEDRLTSQCPDSESLQSTQSKFLQNVKLGYFRQKQVLEILQFIQQNILECDHEDDSLDKLKKQTQKIILKISSSIIECEKTGDMSILPNYFCEYYSAPEFKLKINKIVNGLKKAIHST